jgi:hypothetical protein
VSKRLYLITLYRSTGEDVRMHRKVRLTTDSNARYVGIDWLKSYRKIHAKNPGLYDMWSVYDITDPAARRLVGRGNEAGLTWRGVANAETRIPWQRG